MALPAVGMAKPGDGVMKKVEQGVGLVETIQGTKSQTVHFIGDTLTAPVDVGVSMYDAVASVPTSAAHSTGSTINSTVKGLQKVGETTSDTITQAKQFLEPVPSSRH